ncbi:unnamed protein product [Cunninghamella echinulata]
MVGLKYMVLFLIFYIASINAQGMCGGRDLTHEQSVDAWKCVGMLKQKEGYTVRASSGSCSCQRTGPPMDDDLWNEMNQCAAPGGNHVGGKEVYVYSEGSGCDGVCHGIACWCYVLTYSCQQ